MGHKQAAAPRPEIVTLAPVELAELLGLGTEDAPFLTTAPVRLPAAWIAAWKAKMGPLELTTADITLICGVHGNTVRGWTTRKEPRLRGRRCNNGNGGLHVAPAELVRFLRTLNGTATPRVAPETPAQERDRAKRGRAAAITACGG